MARVLIASEDTSWADLLGSTVNAEGHEAVFATNGRDAYERALETRPQMIFVDMVLPVYSGFELCRLLRADPDISPDVPIVLTGATAPRSRQIEEAGASAHIMKTVSATELREILVEHLSPHRAK